MDSSKITYIYTLSDDTGIRYVGKSNTPYIRVTKHWKECGLRRNRREKWLYELKRSNRKIKVDILDVVRDEGWPMMEMYWIGQFKAWGFDLVNGTKGGEGSNGFQGHKHTKETKDKLRVSCVHDVTGISGTNNCNASLTDEQVLKIRESEYGYYRLSKIYQVSKSTIQRVKNNRTYKKAV